MIAKNFKILLFVTFIFAFDSVSAQKDKISKDKKEGKYQGLLWEISKPGVEKKSYLYGTMHVSSRVAFHLTDSFYVAIKSVDVVGLETNPQYWLKDMMESDSYGFYLQNGFRVSKKGFYSKEFEMQNLEKKNIKYLLSYDSRFSNNLLYRKSQGYKNNFQEDTYLDMFIYQAGMKLGKVVTNLEDFHESDRLVTESRIASRKSKENSKRSEYDFGDKRPFEIIEDAYRDGNLDLLDSIGRITANEDGRKFMLYIRNENIAISIDSIINGGQTVFAAVGAAHLPAEKGVIEELRKRGYILRAVTKSRERDEDQKEIIDSLIHPFTLKERQPDDKAFTAFLPDQIITPPTEFIFTEYQVPDMPNGANYFIRRINTFSPLWGESPEFIQKRIDSLLFENIPGKIIDMNQEEVDEFGHPIISITNETKEGHFQRYKIIITPFELYIFKVIGIKKYAIRDDVKPFIEKARIHYDYDQGWRKIQTEYGGFSVELPGEVKVQDASKFTTLEKNALIQAYDKKSDSYFVLLENTLNDYYYIELDTFELQYIADNFCEELDYDEISKREFSKVGEYPAYYHMAKNEDGDVLHVKTIIQGSHYFLLVSKTKKKALAEKYFDSFKLDKYNIKSEPKLIVDSTLLYTVETHADNPKSPYDRLVESKYDEDEDEDEKFKDIKETVVYFFRETGEKVRVRYNKFHDYKHRLPENAYKNTKYIYDFVGDDDEEDFDPDNYTLEQLIEYYEDRDDKYKNTEAKFQVSRNFFIDSKNKDLKWKEYLITRPNSHRGVYGRYIVYKDRSYNLRTTIDTLTGPSEQVLYFMDHFTPMDTTVGYPILEKKDSIFFAHLTGTDSLLQTRALRSIDYIDFDNSNMEQMMNVLDTMNFERFEEGYNYRLDLIRNSGHIEDPKYLEFLEKKYLEAEDTSSLQISILKAITTTETEAHHKLFLKLLLQETPLTSKSKINGLFGYLEDSIVLNKTLYPGLYELSGVPEYTNNVYEVLVTLLDSNHIDKSFYSDKLDYLYREAKMEMKRFNNKTIDNLQKSNKYNYADKKLFGFESLGNSKLHNLLRLLLPFYKDDERIPKLFSKMMEIHSIKSKSVTARLLHQIGVETDLEVWKSLYESKRKYALPIYLTLKDIGKQDYIEKLGINNDSIAKSIMLYETELDLDKKDSVKLHEIRKIKYKGDDLHVYVYKYKKENKYSSKNTKWKVALVGIEPNSKLSPYFPELIMDGISIKLNKDLDEIIDDKLKNLRFINRERVKIKKSYSSYY